MSSTTLTAVFEGAIGTFWDYVTGLITPVVGLIIAFGLLIAIFGILFRRSHRGVGR